MSVEFRQRRPSEYAKIAWKRKWLIILPTIAIATSVAGVVHYLPDVYESQTLIVVKPSTLPSGVVPTLSDDNLTRQLTSIAQVVTSRSQLEPLVQKYKLYPDELKRGEPMETIIDMMRNNIRSRSTPAATTSPTASILVTAYRVPGATQSVASNWPANILTSRPKPPSAIAPPLNNSSKHRQAGKGRA